jgi:hypothetical protein
LYNFVQIELFLLEGCLLQQAAHPPDNLCATPVIVQNILYYILEFGDVGCRGIQNCFCGFGVGQNRPERLVYFMCNRGGQFASGREAVDRASSAMLPRLHFGDLTPTMLTEQGRNKPRLRQNYRGDEGNLPPIPLQHGWFSEVDFAAGGQTARADPPTLHLPPVEFRRCKWGWWNFDVAGLLTFENANSRSRSPHCS